MHLMQSLMNRRFIVGLSMVMMIAFIGGATTSIPSSLAASESSEAPARIGRTLDTQQLLVSLRTHRYPTGDLYSYHGRSRASLRQQPPVMVNRPTAKSIPGVKKISFLLNKKQTAKAKSLVTDYAARGGLVASGASAALCGVLFLEGTPLASVIMGAVCGIFVGWYWADIQDAMAKVNSRKPCFRITYNFLPIMNITWYDFAASKCLKADK